MTKNEAIKLVEDYVKGLLASKRTREAHNFVFEVKLLPEINEINVRSLIQRFDQGIAL